MKSEAYKQWEEAAMFPHHRKPIVTPTSCLLKNELTTCGAVAKVKAGSAGAVAKASLKEPIYFSRSARRLGTGGLRNDRSGGFAVESLPKEDLLASVLLNSVLGGVEQREEDSKVAVRRPETG